MNAVFTSSTGIILFIFVILLLAAGASYFIFYEWGRKKVQETLKKASAQFRQFGSDLRSLKSSVHGYSIKDPPPFGPLVKQFNTQMDEADRSGQTWLKQYSDIQQDVLADDRAKGKTFFTYPYRWYLLQKKLQFLAETQKQSEFILQKARKILKEVNDQGIVLARHSHVFQQRLNAAEKVLTDLRLKNIQGDALLATYQVLDQMQEKLNEIPAPLAAGDGRQSLSAENKANIIDTFRFLNENQATLDHLEAKTRGWNEQYLAFDSGRKQMEKLRQDLPQLLQEMPQSLDLSNEAQHYQQIDQSMVQIHQKLVDVHLDDLTDHTAAIDLLLKEAQSVYDLLNNAKWHVSEFLQLMANLRPDYEQLVREMAQLSSQPTYPLVWNKSQVQLNDFIQRFEKLEPVTRIRTIAQLDADLVDAKMLQDRLMQLQGQVKDISIQYFQIVPALGKLNSADVFEQVPILNGLVKQIAQYHPDNWDRRDDVSGYETDISAFFQALSAAFPEKSADSLKETGLSSLIEESQKILTQWDQIQQRKIRIQYQFEQLQQAETTALNQLLEARVFLNQIATLTRSNPELQNICAEDIDRLLAAFDQMKDEFDHRLNGIVAKKIQKCNELLAQVDQTSKSWLFEFSEIVRQSRDLLSNRVNSLAGIANLDEPHLLNAQDFLQSIGNASPRRENEPKRTSESLSQVIADLKKANDEHLQYLAYLNSIEDIDKSIHDAYDKVEKQRLNARNLLIQSAKWLASARDWPPISIDLNSEHFEFEQIERSRKSALTEKNRAIWLVSTLGDLSARYQQLAASIQGAQKKAEEDINRISKVDHDIEEAVQLWQYQKNTYSNNTLVTVRINQLIEELSNEREDIKKQSRQALKSFAEIEQDLIRLSKKSYTSLIPLKDDQRIDINGEIHIIGRI